MLEIVFSSSAGGSLNMARSFGRGPYTGGSTGVFLVHSDGTAPSEAEIAEAQRRAEEASRKEWELAQPMEPGDVHPFSLGLSVGDISEDRPGPVRRAALCGLCAGDLLLPGISEQIDNCLNEAEESLKTVLQRSAAGEAVRIWFSGEPDELCGFCWMLAQLDGLGEDCGPIRMVKLPQWEQREDGAMVERSGWGEVSPGEWGRFLPLEQAVSPVLRKSCAARWRALQGENAPLRAVLNGQLVSAPEDLYDSFIRRELEREESEFQEARLIGKLLGRFRLGIGDGWVANRIEAMIAAGELEAVTQPEEGNPSYRRILRKQIN